MLIEKDQPSQKINQILENHRFKSWGLRGDPPLWKYFKLEVAKENLSSKTEVCNKLKEVFECHTGVTLHKSELETRSSFSGVALLPDSEGVLNNFRGMSGGLVCIKFWLHAEKIVSEILDKENH